MFRSHSKIWYVDLRTNSDFRSRSFDLFPPTLQIAGTSARHLWTFLCQTIKSHHERSRVAPKKALNWIMGSKQTCYANSLSLLNTLPLPMFEQMNDLLFSSLTRGNLANILNLHTKVTCNAHRPMNPKNRIDVSQSKAEAFGDWHFAVWVLFHRHFVFQISPSVVQFRLKNVKGSCRRDIIWPAIPVIGCSYSEIISSC